MSMWIFVKENHISHFGDVQIQELVGSLTPELFQNEDALKQIIRAYLKVFTHLGQKYDERNYGVMRGVLDFIYLLLKHHPDAGGDEAMMRSINEAWETIVLERRAQSPHAIRRTTLAHSVG